MYSYIKFLLIILVLSVVTNKLFWINGKDFYIVLGFYPIEKSGILVELGIIFEIILKIWDMHDFSTIGAWLRRVDNLIELWKWEK